MDTGRVVQGRGPEGCVTVVMQRPGQQQHGTGQLGGRRRGEGRVQQRQLADVLEEVHGAPLQVQQVQQHLAVVQQHGRLEGGGGSEVSDAVTN